MVEQFFVVDLVVDVETVPEVAANHYATESQCLHLTYVVDVHTTKSIHFFVDETVGCCSLQLLACERGFLVSIRLTVEDRVQEHVVAVSFCLFELLDGVASARQITFVAHGWLRMGIVDVNPPQVELLLQVEMTVDGNPVVVFILQ